ncbi:class I SAM-dependent methyltransferase [Neorhizobium sp. P12A]|uniref:class I SAM-dependent methyltransferase n=1 Tax=Neorhizobium sp. P12A TaxID=2268027 RepID=UPI0011ECC9B8|nr:class I SAM-dependent methyltransferase [Neorhizobium sp. P12A]KAA0698602.1 class I SAM-dependent methyltransferase [Neorhizobium sp. P12A]
MNSSLRKFVFHDLQTIEGYIDPPDALVFLSLLQTQKQAGLEGPIAEIGVFYGRSYFLFKRIGGDAEKIVAIDLFDIGQTADGISPQYGRFLENGRRLGIPIEEDLIIRGDSTRLAAADITEKAGKVRFFSIDGGHALSDVVSDSRLAMHSLADHGIIAFDDTFNPAWPEVTVGVADFLREHADSFAAFCMTKYKTYVCRRDFHDLYYNAIADASDLNAFEQTETTFLDSRVIRLHNPIGRRMLYELMIRTGMGAYSERVYR